LILNEECNDMSLINKMNLIKRNPYLPLKLVILGEGGVGKTTLSKTFIDGEEFVSTTTQTIMIDTHSTYYRIVDEKTKAKVTIWDLGGQERFKNSGMFHEYCKGADGAILCFDLTDLSSLFALPEWIRFLESDVPRFLIGTKLDLASDEEREIDLSHYKNRYNCGSAYLSSSINVNSVVEILLNILLELEKNRLEKINKAQEILQVEVQQPKWMQMIPKFSVQE
jgi:small GTP-binding protein